MVPTFRLTSPHMHGATQLQAHVNGHLKAWNVPQDSRLTMDGEYGELTKLRVHEVCFGLGIEATAIANGIGPVVQSKLTHNNLLTPAELNRLKERSHWRHRLAFRLSGGKAGHGVAFAKEMAAKGIVEHPAGSNTGPYITNWEQMAGYSPPPGVYWCGCFINACLIAAGLPSQGHWGIGYVPYIEAHAKGGVDGWVWHSPNTSPQAGWISTFGPNGGIAEHTEYVVQDNFPLNTVGGNTSAGHGSPNNGGGVYAHNFATYQGFPLRGFAAPNYH